MRSPVPEPEASEPSPAPATPAVVSELAASLASSTDSGSSASFSTGTRPAPSNTEPDRAPHGRARRASRAWLTLNVSSFRRQLAVVVEVVATPLSALPPAQPWRRTNAPGGANDATEEKSGKVLNTARVAVATILLGAGGESRES